jgi:hypothetical protein
MRGQPPAPPSPRCWAPPSEGPCLAGSGPAAGKHACAGRCAATFRGPGTALPAPEPQCSTRKLCRSALFVRLRPAVFVRSRSHAPACACPAARPGSGRHPAACGTRRHPPFSQCFSATLQRAGSVAQRGWAALPGPLLACAASGWHCQLPSLGPNPLNSEPSARTALPSPCLRLRARVRCAPARTPSFQCVPAPQSIVHVMCRLKAAPCAPPASIFFRCPPHPLNVSLVPSP